MNNETVAEIKRAIAYEEALLESEKRKFDSLMGPTLRGLAMLQLQLAKELILFPIGTVITRQRGAKNYRAKVTGAGVAGEESVTFAKWLRADGSVGPQFFVRERDGWAAESAS
jgi:hypothetical protein